jgi:hypothetical protein
MFHQKMCVKSVKLSGTFARMTFSRINQASVGWAVSALSRAYAMESHTRKAGASLVRAGAGIFAASALAGCSVDMSRFAGAIGGATAEFTCAIVQQLFACEL